MNGPETPAFIKHNRFTDLIERVAEINAAEGKPAGRALAQAAEHFQPVIPQAVLRRMTAAEQDRVAFRPEPLDPTDVMRRTTRAQALGITDSDLAAGVPLLEPTEDDITAMLPPRFRTPPPARPGTTATEPVGVQSLQRPDPVVLDRITHKLPDFSKVQGFDLMKGVLVVDDVEFPLQEVDIRDMKKFALHVVLEGMTIQVAQALIAFGIPVEMARQTAETLRKTAAESATGGVSGTNSGGAGETVLQVPSTETTKSVHVETEQMQNMPEDEGSATDTDWLLADVR